MTDIHASVENQVLVSDSHASQLQDWLENALIRAGKAQHLSFCNHNQGLMSTSASSGSLEPSSAFDVIDLHVRCLNCEGCMLKLSGSSMGLEVRRMVLKHLPPRRPTLHLLDAPLVLHKTLWEQGIMGRAATLSCTYVPTDLHAAWCSIRKQSSALPAEFDLEGVTQLAGITTTTYLHHLLHSLESLTFHHDFNESLEGVSLPNNLQSLTLGSFNWSMRGWTCQAVFRVWNLAIISTKAWKEWPFQAAFNIWHLAMLLAKAWKEWPCPAVLRAWHLATGSIRMWKKFPFLAVCVVWIWAAVSIRACDVILPSSLESLTLGNLNCVILPTNLQRLMLGFSSNLKHFTLPRSLQSLTLGKLARTSMKAWNSSLCRAVLRAWDLAVISTRAWKEWPCQTVLRNYDFWCFMVLPSTRTWKEWPFQAAKPLFDI